MTLRRHCLGVRECTCVTCGCRESTANRGRLCVRCLRAGHAARATGSPVSHRKVYRTFYKSEQALLHALSRSSVEERLSLLAGIARHAGEEARRGR